MKGTESIFSQMDRSMVQPLLSYLGEKGLKESTMDYSYSARVQDALSKIPDMNAEIRLRLAQLTSKKQDGMRK